MNGMNNLIHGKPFSYGFKEKLGDTYLEGKGGQHNDGRIR